MIRRDPIYISSDVWRACWLIAKAQPNVPHKESATADSVADGIIRDVITEKYPQLLEHQKEVAKMEEKLLKTL